MSMESINYQNDSGFASEVKISNDVIASIAAFATAEVEGIDGIMGTMGKLGPKNSFKGVSINFEPDGKSVSCSLSAIIKYGFGIPETCKLVQDKVKSAIESMVGLKVSEVKVNIADVSVPEK